MPTLGRLVTRRLEYAWAMSWFTLSTSQYWLMMLTNVSRMGVGSLIFLLVSSFRQTTGNAVMIMDLYSSLLPAGDM